MYASLVKKVIAGGVLKRGFTIHNDRIEFKIPPDAIWIGGLDGRGIITIEYKDFPSRDSPMIWQPYKDDWYAFFAKTPEEKFLIPFDKESPPYPISYFQKSRLAKPA